jgi:hypothetical protein
MKKLLIILCVFIGLSLFPTTASADSPVTSTSFYRAYMDNEIVAEAHEEKKVNANIAKYLSDKNNPIDVKAAVINAISWDSPGDPVANKYCQLIYKKSLDKINTDKLSGDQLFCIGYLLAMENYSDVTPALKYLRLAEQKINDSFTVSIIRAVVESMNAKTSEGRWDYIPPVLKNTGLKRDLRQDAINIILDYMASYDEDGLQVSSNNVLIKNEKNQTIYLYGTYAVHAYEVLYKITQNSSIAYTALSKDQYGISYVTITGVKNGSSSIQVANFEGKSAVISFSVVSKEAYSKLNSAVAMYIGCNHAYLSKTNSNMTKKEKPFLKGGVPFLPVEYSIKAFGGKYKYDSKNKTYQITYGHKTILLTSGKKSATINGKVTTLTSNIVYRNQQLFISVKDFVTLINKKYVYSDGLIFLADKAIQIDAVKDDYILEEIATLVTGQNLTVHAPIPFMKDGKYGYEDDNGKVILEPTYTMAYDFHDGLAAVSIADSEGREKFGYIDVTGNYVIAPAYSKAGTFGTGRAPVLNAEGTLWGFIDTSGSLVIPYSYSDCTTFCEGMSAVQKDGKWGYIDITGNYILQPVYDSAHEFSDGLANATLGSCNYVISKSGKSVFFYDNGDTYVGDSKDGLSNGPGVYTWADGTQYVGNFTDGKRAGKGIFTNHDGSVLDGYWDNNKYMGKEQ